MGTMPWRFEQDGKYFNHDGLRVNEDGKVLAAKKAETAEAEVGEDGKPPEKPPWQAVSDIDATIPYETHEKPSMTELRARYIFVSKGKKLPVGTSKVGAIAIINEATGNA